MNVVKAKAIPLTDIMAKLGHSQIRSEKGGRDVWYKSPFREEADASFHINTVKNIWYDFGEASGGTVIDFVMTHESYTSVSEALKFLRKFDTRPSPNLFNQNVITPPPTTAQPNALRIVKNQKIQAKGLLAYLKARHIPEALALHYLREVHYRNDGGKTYYALAMENEKGGFEIRNRYFKGSLGTKGITLIPAGQKLNHSVHVFEGMFDYLACLADNKVMQLEEDVVVLHSLSFISRLQELVKERLYTAIYDYLDNDAAGNKQREVINSWTVYVKDMRYKFSGYKDYNEKVRHQSLMTP